MRRVCGRAGAWGLSARSVPDGPRRRFRTAPQMNAIFSAQADRVPIDACLLGPSDSPFLQQARAEAGPAGPRALL